MTFEEITDLDGRKHIIIDFGNGAFKSFPADESNPEYVAWAVAEGLMEAPVEPEVVDPEVVAEPDPAP